MKLIIFSLLLISPFSHADLSEQIDKIVQEEVKKGFQGNVYVHGPEGEIFSRSYGMANLEFDVPNNRSTKFRIGSITKQFTATAILKLFADKKINSLHDPIAYYISVPDSWKTVTFHQLLTHTAGIPHDPQYVTPTAHHTLNQLYDLIMTMTPRPDAKYEYSNAGYELLAYLVQEISKESFEDFVIYHILQPAGLTNTSPDLDMLIVPNRARGYMSIDGQLFNAFGYDISIINGAGNFISTVDDLYKWDQVLRGEKILPAHICELLFKPHVKSDTSHYGYGWVIDQFQGHKLIWHNGVINGYVSDFARYVDDQLVIITLSNRYDAGVSLMRIREKTAKLILKAK